MGRRRGFESDSGAEEKKDEQKREEEEEKEEEQRKERGEDYYDRMARETRREVLGENGNKETSPELNCSEGEEKFREQGSHGEEYYDRLARETRYEVLGRGRDEQPLPERSVSELGDRSPVRAEAGEVFRNLERNGESLFEVRRCISSGDFRKAEAGTRKQVLEQYDRFLYGREEILRKLRPDAFSKPDFRDQCLSDTSKLTETRKFLDNAKDSNLPEKEPEKYAEALNRYEELLNKRYGTLARIEPKPRPPEWVVRRKDSKPEPEKRLRFARRYIPERAAGRRGHSKPEGTLHVVSEGWVQRDGDEKSVVERAVVRGEKSGARFEHSVEHIKSESPLSEAEGIVKRSEARVEKDVVWDEDSVRRIYLEISRIKEAYKTRTDRPYAGLLELVDEAEKRTVLTVVDRGERRWLRDMDYVVVTKKLWTDEKSAMHTEQCTQVIGHKKTEKGETVILEAALTDRAQLGLEKNEKTRVETTFRFNPKVTFEKQKAEKPEGESKPSITDGHSEAVSVGEEQQALLSFHGDEKVEKPENVHNEQVIYIIEHEPSQEENANGLAENAERADETEGGAENFEKTANMDGYDVNGENAGENNALEKTTTANGVVETAETVDTAEKHTSQSQYVVEDNLTSEHSGEEVEDENPAENVKHSFEHSKEGVSHSEELCEDVFILVEGRGRRRILPVLNVLVWFVEGIIKNGGDEERYCKELIKRGAPPWLSGWLLRQKVYEHKVPEDVLRVALEYLGKDADRELSGCEASLKPKTVTKLEADASSVSSEDELESEEIGVLDSNGVEVLSDGKVAFETPEDDKKWFESLDYEKSTVLILGTVYSFSLFSKDVLSKVIEAKNRSKLEGNKGILQTCYKALRQFHEEGCIGISHLLSIARYLFQKIDRKASQSEETETILNTYSSELKNIEELLQLFGTEYRKTSEELSVLEPLEPYERVKISQEHLKEIRQRIKETLGSTTELYSELERLYGELERRIPLNSRNVSDWLGGRGRMFVDIYLKICHILGIEKDLKVVTRWQNLTVDIATGKWYNHSGAKISIHPKDREELYKGLLKELKRRKISLEKFARTNLMEKGAIISNAKQLKEILRRKHTDTIALLEICKFLKRSSSEIRELERNDMPSEENVTVSRKVKRMLHLKAFEKYGSNYIGELAKEIKVIRGGYLRQCFYGERKMPLKFLEKIEEILTIKIKDELHLREEVKHMDLKGEIIEGEDEWKVMVEKIEINEPDGRKIPLLTFIHRRGEGGVIFTEIVQTKEKIPSHKTPWFLSSGGTQVTVNRTKEFREGKDLLTYIIEKGIEKAGSIQNLCKILNISQTIVLKRFLPNHKNKWRSFSQKGIIILKFLLALAMYSGAIGKLSELTNYIENVGVLQRKYNPDLTIDLNTPDGASIVIVMLGDGTFIKSRRGYKITYAQKEIDFEKDFVEKIRNVCGLILTINEERGLKVVYVNCYLLATGFLRIGLKPGRKTSINPEVPRPIKDGTPQMLKSGIRTIISDEGTLRSYLAIHIDVNAPELEQYRNVLNQIKGRIIEKNGRFIKKIIAVRKLEDYKEILSIVKNTQSNILKGVLELIAKLLTKHGIKLEIIGEIRAVRVNVKSKKISVSNWLQISVDATKYLHKILGGFPGFKELMYCNYVSVGNEELKFPLSLNSDEIDILKGISRQRKQKGVIQKVISVEDKKLPEHLKRRHASPPKEILERQKEYSQKEVEILVNGKPVKVNGMPSRIKGEIILSPKENVVSWKLIPGKIDEIKKKWEEIKSSLKNENEVEKEETEEKKA